MGKLDIHTRGSFGDSIVGFSAMEHGHANAVAAAIVYLSEDVLPRAIALDHKLHDEGKKPTDGFSIFA